MRSCSAILSLLACLLLACGNPSPGKVPDQSAATSSVAQAEVVTPPFAVAGDAQGLLLVWYDADGAPHTAQKRSDVPESQRAHVRVDSLSVAPERRLDAAFVYVADLRAPGADGRYVVRKVARETFETAMAKAPAPEVLAQAGAGSDVIIYGAEWCGACKSAASYLKGKGVPFVEKDIEREPGARSEMLDKARAQGVNASGIPVIDVYGKLMGGFNPVQMDRLLATK